VKQTVKINGCSLRSNKRIQIWSIDVRKAKAQQQQQQQQQKLLSILPRHLLQTFFLTSIGAGVVVLVVVVVGGVSGSITVLVSQHLILPFIFFSASAQN